MYKILRDTKTVMKQFSLLGLNNSLLNKRKEKKKNLNGGWRKDPVLPRETSRGMWMILPVCAEGWTLMMVRKIQRYGQCVAGTE